MKLQQLLAIPTEAGKSLEIQHPFTTEVLPPQTLDGPFLYPAKSTVSGSAAHTPRVGGLRAFAGDRGHVAWPLAGSGQRGRAAPSVRVVQGERDREEETPA